MKPQQYLERIAGVSMYPIITLIVFLLFFSILAIWVLRARKQTYESMGQLPLDGGEMSGDAINHPNC